MHFSSNIKVIDLLNAVLPPCSILKAKGLISLDNSLLFLYFI